MQIILNIHRLESHLSILRGELKEARALSHALKQVCKQSEQCGVVSHELRECIRLSRQQEQYINNRIGLLERTIERFTATNTQVHDLIEECRIAIYRLE